MSDTKLVIARTKGRILEEVLPLLASAGLRPAEDIYKSRKLIFDTNLEDVQLMILRGSDVPTYVELGSADIGITGKDILMENGSDGYYEPLDRGAEAEISRRLAAWRARRRRRAGACGPAPAGGPTAGRPVRVNRLRRRFSLGAVLVLLVVRCDTCGEGCFTGFETNNN